MFPLVFSNTILDLEERRCLLGTFESLLDVSQTKLQPCLMHHIFIAIRFVLKGLAD